MKHNPFFKKSLFVLLLSLVLLTLSACGQNSVIPQLATTKSPTPSMTVTMTPTQSLTVTVQPTPSSESLPADISDNKDPEYHDALDAYKGFLEGTIDAQDANHKISDGIVTIKDISLDPDYKTYYALFDMNGDGVPELHLRPIIGGSYVIFTYQEGQISLWYAGTDYESPLNNGAILYQRDGAAPTHINYYYIVLDSDGNEISTVYFSKYHSIDENGLNESTSYDKFIFEDKEVSQDEWNSLTDEYLSIPSDFIIWNKW